MPDLTPATARLAPVILIIGSLVVDVPARSAPAETIAGRHELTLELQQTIAQFDRMLLELEESMRTVDTETRHQVVSRLALIKVLQAKLRDAAVRLVEAPEADWDTVASAATHLIERIRDEFGRICTGPHPLCLSGCTRCLSRPSNRYGRKPDECGSHVRVQCRVGFWKA